MLEAKRRLEELDTPRAPRVSLVHTAADEDKEEARRERMRSDLEDAVRSLCVEMGVVWDEAGVAHQAYTAFGEAEDDEGYGEEYAEGYEGYGGEYEERYVEQESESSVGLEVAAGMPEGSLGTVSGGGGKDAEAAASVENDSSAREDA